MGNFGEYIESVNYRVLNERTLRASGGIMFFLGLIAFINGVFLKNYVVITYVSGFLMLNFLIGIFINPKFSPTIILGRLIVRKQKPLFVGAIQKKFAWSMGLALSTIIFILSIYLLNDESYFGTVCKLCLLCLTLIYIEVAFGICIGCKIYNSLIAIKLIKMPAEKPNCIGDACSTDNK